MLPTIFAAFLLAAPASLPGGRDLLHPAYVPSDTLDTPTALVASLDAPDYPAPPTDSTAEEPVPLPEVHLSLGGFISATAFAQNQSFGFGNGQSAVFAGNRHETVDMWFMGGDVRSTRLRLRADTRPVATGWMARGVLEVDFFGAFTGTGAFNDEQPQPRLRLAYVELVHGSSTIRVGQSWTPFLGLVPTSVTHVAFPLGIGSAGLVGWRYPGLLVKQRLTGAQGGAGPVELSVELGAFRGSWTPSVLGDASEILDHRSPGEAGVPQIEGRLDASGSVPNGRWRAYLAGHVDRKDLSGVGDRFDEDDRLVGRGVELGGKIESGAWTVQGNGHAGRAMGQQFAAITQFGDIGSQGGWAQVGRQLTPGVSVWAFRGFEDPVDGDVLASGNARLHNRSTALSLQFDAGPYRAGLEWLESVTRWATDDGPRDFDAHQISFSVLYAF